MKKFLIGVVMLLLLFFVVFEVSNAAVDLRTYIDSGRVYSNSDSLEFIGGAAAYDGYSDTVSVVGANTISVDFILTRITATTTTGIVTVLQGSKDGVNFITLTSVSVGDTTKISAVGIRSFTVPYATAFNQYRLKVLSDTTFSAMTKWKVGDRVSR